MDEQNLLDKLKRIEALYAGATTPGERDAAANARARIKARLDAGQQTFSPEEYVFTLGDHYSRSLFVALARKHHLEPFRYRRQRHTTVVLRADALFVDSVLWPQYLELSETLNGYLTDVTKRIIREAIHADVSEASVVDTPKSLSAPL